MPPVAERLPADDGRDDAPGDPAGSGQPAHPSQNASFEDLLAQLGDIVLRLEGGGIGLSESIECYERGVVILRHLHEELAGAERRIRTLTGVDEQGRPICETDAAGERQAATDSDPSVVRPKPAESPDGATTPGRRKSAGRPARSRPLPGMDGVSDDV